MKNKKGFTLVELLAVIAILAILVIMALPAVLRMYRQSRVNNFQNEVRSTYRAVQSQFLGDSMLLGSGGTIVYTNGCNSVSGVDLVKTLDMTGNSNFKYYVKIDVDGKIQDVKASNGTYSYIKTGSDIKIEELNVEEGNGATLDSDISSTICTATGSSGGSSSSVTNIATCVTSGCTKTEVGTELTIGGENFYVVSSDATNTVLLAKYDLKEDGTSYSQDTSGTSTNTVRANFLDSNNTVYWDNANCVYNGRWSCPGTSNGLKSKYSEGDKAYCTSESGTNCAYVYDSNAVNIYPVVNSYASKIGTAAGATITGRLMSLEEAYSLNANIRKDMNSYLYWLGSAVDLSFVWDVYSDGNIYSSTFAVNPYGVRPVIVVSTSAL